MTYKSDMQRRRKRLPRLIGYKRLDEYGDACPMCRRQDVSATDFNIHHVIPIVEGGTSPPWNLIKICRTCHAVLEFGSTEDAVEKRIKAHQIQAGRYGLLYLLYFIRITGSEDGRRGLQAALNMWTRRDVDEILRQAYTAIDIERPFVVS